MSSPCCSSALLYRRGSWQQSNREIWSRLIYSCVLFLLLASWSGFGCGWFCFCLDCLLLASSSVFLGPEPSLTQHFMTLDTSHHCYWETADKGSSHKYAEQRTTQQVLQLHISHILSLLCFMSASFVGLVWKNNILCIQVFCYDKINFFCHRAAAAELHTRQNITNLIPEWARSQNHILSELPHRLIILPQPCLLQKHFDWSGSKRQNQ